MAEETTEQATTVAEPTTTAAAEPTRTQTAATESTDFEARLGKMESHIGKLNDENKDRRLENNRLRQENEQLRQQVTDGKLDGKERKAREVAVTAAKDRALKVAAAQTTVDRVMREAIRKAEDGDMVVDAEQVRGLIKDIVVSSINPDVDVDMNVGGDGELDVFLKTDTVTRLEKTVARIVGIASRDKTEATAPPKPGGTSARTNGASLEDSLPPQTMIWDSNADRGKLPAARQKVREAAARAGSEGLLARMDTGL